jgi:alkylation response protein AidB-like acyl-CoA dehydrogenase
MYLPRTDEQELLLASLEDVLQRHLTPEYLQECDDRHEEPLEFHRAMVESGFSMLGLSEEVGGTPTDMVTMSMMSERVARQGYYLGYGSAALQANSIMRYGSAEQKALVLDALNAGPVAFCLAATEPVGGSDTQGMQCAAVHQDGKVVINGTKTLITGAMTAPYLMLIAQDPGEPDPRKKISMYMVPTSTPGITISPFDKIAWHMSQTCEIFFDDVILDESALVGSKGNGFIQQMHGFEQERCLLASTSLGMAEAAFEDAATHAATRKAFGQPIGNFQQIQMYLTDMATQIENMHSFVFTYSQMIDAGQDVRTFGALCKRYCARSAFEVIDTALQIFGGSGFANGTRVSRLWRDSRVNRVGGGTDEIMVHIAGRQIVKAHTPR